jgi:hypothetical protein
MKQKNILMFGVFVLIIILLFVWSSFLNPERNLVASWKTAGVECLPLGHQNLSQHIHQKLSITVDGAVEAVPATIGIAKNCMAEIHTHEADNVIHVETVAADKQFTLEDFFAVWGTPLEREGYTLSATVDDKPVAGSAADIVLVDGMSIALTYSK